MWMHLVEMIARKRDGGVLTSEEIHGFVSGVTNHSLPEYQISALLMAILFQGLDSAELTVLTLAMRDSGDVLDLSAISRPKLDKHSTGGVGDKISIPLAPIVTACGLAVPMISGRGLGHTGGTLDKLESIPGFTTPMTPDMIASQLAIIGLAFTGQSETLVPADRHLYAMRDASGTVPSIPLITSSILSKKLAEHLDALVLDVKFGSGAFLPDYGVAKELAETMVRVGKGAGTPITAFLTRMDQPLGFEVGNASEIRESLATLRGEGPDDVKELTFALGAEMLILGNLANSEEEARDQMEWAVTSGSAMDVFRQVIIAQSGNPAVIEDESLLPSAEGRYEIRATTSGIVTRCDARTIGVAAVRLGGGRQAKADTIDPAVGITLAAKLGDKVEKGNLLATVAWTVPAKLEDALQILPGAWTLGDSYEHLPLIAEKIS
jgi:pyrimidine-nucleoside phosphorylase